MPSAKPLIERNEAIAAIVHLEIFVVQVVGVGVAIHRAVIGQFELVEADVPDDRAVGRAGELEKGDERVRRDEQEPPDL